MSVGNVSRRSLLGAAGLGAAGLSAAERLRGAGPQPAAGTPPNILIFIADQVRWDAVGAYGLNSMDLTPNLDAMAQRGTLYRSMFTNQPVCSPSRACLFTGQYPARHGVWRSRGRVLGLQPMPKPLQRSAGRRDIQQIISANGTWRITLAGRCRPPVVGDF